MDSTLKSNAHTDNNERRKNSRVAVELSLTLSCQSGACEQHKVEVLDMSLGGMLIYTGGVELGQGQDICLCLDPAINLCSSEHIIQARVVRVEEQQAGIQFESLGVAVLRDLQQMLKAEKYF